MPHLTHRDSHDIRTVLVAMVASDDEAADTQQDVAGLTGRRMYCTL